MDMPLILKQAVENLTAGLQQKEIKKHAQRISLRYRNEKQTANKALLNDTEAAVYAVSRMPATFGAVCSVFQSTPFFENFYPETMIDVGSGTGSAVWAAKCFFDFKQISCLESKAAMRHIGEKLFQEGTDFFHASPEWRDFDLRFSEFNQTADLVTASYVLNELEESFYEKALSALWQATKQALVIIEPGTSESFKRMKAFRTFLINNGAFIAAPCPHNDLCPNQWCHFSCRIARSKGHRLSKNAEAPYEDEKFTYLVALRNPSVAKGMRVLRSPFIEKGKVTLSLCSTEGLREKIVTKKDKNAYKTARKLKWGDLFNPTE